MRRRCRRDTAGLLRVQAPMQHSGAKLFAQQMATSLKAIP